MKIIQHPNGFVRVELSAGDPETGWDRVHIWNIPGLADGADIHQHSYDFTSTILAGVMEEELFTYHEDPDGEWDRCTVEGYSDDTGEYHIDMNPETVRVTPVCTETIVHKPGESYFRPKADFHLVTAVEVPLITRCMTSPQTNRIHYLLRQVK